MTSTGEPRAQHPSLIVKLRYKFLCPKCIDVLSTQGLTRIFLDGAVEGSELGRSVWAWNLSALRNSSTSCSCCAFFVQILDTIPGVQYTDEDYILIKSELIGSQHLTSHRRAEAQYVTHSPPDDSAAQITEYKRHYRPNLQVYQRGTDVAIDPTREPVYSLRTSTFVLPLTQANLTLTNPSDAAAIFLGRRVEPEVNFSLLQSWVVTCTSTHTRTRATYLTDKMNERPRDSDGCRPNPLVLLPNFRLVDIENKCIVHIDQPTEYAALSYVWGKAKRLLLTTQSERWLSTPGALSATNPDVPQTFQDAFIVAEQLSIRYLWIDGLCICQDDVAQMEKHMESMDKVYSSAVLTIVSDTSSADTGIPGISMARGPPQASFTWANTEYISTRETFGEALKYSPWESRAWCLQEKVFSKRLLIFTESQTFYHCAAATWFEDTVMEPKDNSSGAVFIHERTTPLVKANFRKKPQTYYMAYEAHREYFGHNFWSLVKVYSKRHLSFEEDTIRAFSSILKSVEPDFGPSIWGIPSNDFARGLTWIHSEHLMSLRREVFPSWSWAGWRGNAGVELQFRNCKRTDADMQVSRGRYRIRACDNVGSSVWTIDWHRYVLEPNGSYHVESTTKGLQATVLAPVNDHATHNGTRTANLASEGEPVVSHRPAAVTDAHTWQLSGHPSAVHEGFEAPQHDSSVTIPQDISSPKLYRDGLSGRPESTSIIRGIKYNPLTMPPLSHIITFYTSVATVFIAEEPLSALAVSTRYYNRRSGERTKCEYTVSVPNSQEPIGVVELDPAWSGGGQLHTLVYISRWCPDHRSYEDQQHVDFNSSHEKLNVLLVESVKGWGEVKRRVQMLKVIKLLNWRKAEPRWEAVSLA
jgi:hypothetical protein